MRTAVVSALLCTGDGHFALAQTTVAKKLDPAILPLVGGDTDVGVGVGFLASLARPGKDATGPFQWKAAATAVTTFKLTDGEIVVPYQDYVLNLAYRDVPNKRGRVDLGLGYTDAQLRYAGLGNASATAIEPEYDAYRRRSALVQFRMRSSIGTYSFHDGSLGFIHNSVEYGDNSRIVVDQSSPDAAIRNAAKLPKEHGVALFTQALGYDSRDREQQTSRGFYHRVSVRISPAGASSYFVTPYVGTGIYLRGYHTLISQRLIFAWRIIGDVIIGTPPTYELGRHEGGWALGGTDGLRGVPQQRYYGAVKALGTVEFRGWIIPFRLAGQDMRLGAAAFVDAGRVFAGTTQRLDLDGSSFNIKYGIGGGPRLAQGRSFEARFDVAYSPDARPIGAYVGAGQAF